MALKISLFLKTELRLISTNLIILFGTDILKDYLIKNMCNAMTNTQSNTVEFIFYLINDEQENMSIT